MNNSPDSSASTKKHWTAELKEDNQALTERNAALEAELARLREARTEQVVVSTPGTTIVEPAPVAKIPDDDEYHEELDPLRWITDETYEVYLISKDSHFLLTPAGENTALGKVGSSAWQADYRVSQGLRKWKQCPIDFGGVDEEDRRSRKAAHEKWHLHIFTPEDAFMAFPAGHPTRDRRTKEDIENDAPLPGRAIIYPEEFKGKSTRSALLGKRRKVSNCLLREWVRLVLQMGCDTTHFHTGRNEYRENALIDNDAPNPYAKHINYKGMEPMMIQRSG